MNINLNTLRDKVVSAGANVVSAGANVNFNEIRSSLASNLNSVRDNIAQNTRIDVLRTKLNGYVPAPTAPPGETSAGASASGRSSSTPRASVVQIPDEESGGIVRDVRSEVQALCNLSATQRYQAFGACFLLGVIMILLSFMSLSVGHITPFAVFYSFGNLLSFTSTLFLVGWRQHLATMSQEGRAVASAVAVVSIVLTLCAALWWRIKILVLVFAITQLCAQFWYSLTYIPYGRTLLKKLCGRCISAVDEG